MNRTLPALLSARRWLAIVAACFVIVCSVPAQAEEVDDALLDIQHRWAQANYGLEGKERKRAFGRLLDDARRLAESHPDRADLLTWQGIIASTYAGAKGPFGALSLAKEARDVLHRAESLDPTVLNGSVYTSLGTLYYKVPGGIIGFGDKDLARRYLDKALSVNPDGIDPNYFYGEFLFEEGQLPAARDALLKAQHAAPRPDRPLADKGRQSEIAALLAKVNQQLGQSS